MKVSVKLVLMSLLLFTQSLTANAISKVDHSLVKSTEGSWTLSLAEFREKARKELEDFYGPLSGEGEIIFEDGYNTSMLYPDKKIDLASVYYAVPIKPISDLDPSIRATYSLNPSGNSDIGLLKYDSESNRVWKQWAHLSLILTFKEAVDINTKIETIKSSYPDIETTQLTLCPSPCTWDSPLVPGLLIRTVDKTPKQGSAYLSGILSLIGNDLDLTQWEFSGRVLQGDPVFGKAQSLGDGLIDSIIDLNTLRDVTPN